MKKHLIVLPSFFLLILLPGCSSLISKSDCKKDMHELGLHHGKKGFPNYIDEVRKTCMSNEKSVDLESYQKGWAIGWSDYCTPFHGYEMGRKGDLYKSFCPSDKEELFREKFLIGKKIYEKKDQISDLEISLKDLSNNELSKAMEDIRVLKNDIQSLEQQGTSLIHTN